MRTSLAVSPVGWLSASVDVPLWQAAGVSIVRRPDRGLPAGFADGPVRAGIADDPVQLNGASGRTALTRVCRRALTGQS